VAEGFVEFRPVLGGCRFRDCRHLDEPGCAVLEAAARGQIQARRLASYQHIVRELLDH
jgi:ribosome biogenesis GTPase